MQPITPPPIRDLIVAFQDPHLPSATREVISRQLEEFKNSPNSLGISFDLFANETRRAPINAPRPREIDLVRHFCLHTALHVCKVNWTLRFSPLERANIAQNCFTVLEQFMLHPNEARYVEQTAVALVLFAAEREAPETWPEFPTRVIGLLSISPHHMKTALAILGTLSQDCCDAEFCYNLTASRRASLMKMLQALAPRLVSPTLNFLLVPASDIATHSIIIMDMLTAYSHIFLWLGVADGVTIQSIENFANLACSTTATTATTSTGAMADIQLKAMECLQIIVGKKNLQPLGACAIFDALLPCFRAAFQPPTTANNSNNNTIIEATAVCLSQLIHTHAEALLEAGRDVFGILTIACTTPSCFVLCIPAWRELIAMKKLVPETLKQLAFGAIATYSALSAVTNHPNTNNEDDDEDVITGPLKSLLRDLARLHTLLCCTALVDACTTILTGNAPRQDLVPGLTLMLDSIQSGIEPITLDKFAHCVFVFQLNVQQPRLQKGLEFIGALDRALNIILDCKPVHTLEGLNLMQTCAPFLTCHPRGMMLYLDRALELFCSVLQISSDGALRRKAVTCLLGMCRRVSRSGEVPVGGGGSTDGGNIDELTWKERERFTAEVVLPALITRVSKLSNLSVVERVRVLESAIVLGANLPTPEAKLALARDVLQFPFQIFTSQETQRVLDNIAMPHPAMLSVDMDYAWGTRGFLFDMEALPEATKTVHEAAFLLSTCCQEGAVLDPATRETMTMCAVKILCSIFALWRGAARNDPNTSWQRTLHPTDAKIALGNHRAEMLETLMDDLVQEGTRLKRARCAVVAFLSSMRSTCTSLLATSVEMGCFNAQRQGMDLLSFDLWNNMEDRHVADFLLTVGVRAATQAWVMDLLRLCVGRFEEDAGGGTSESGRFPTIPSSVPSAVRDVLNETCRALLQTAFVKVAMVAGSSLSDDVLYASLQVVNGLLDTNTLRGFCALWCDRLEMMEQDGVGSSGNTTTSTQLRVFCATRVLPTMIQKLMTLQDDDPTVRRRVTDVLAAAICLVCYDKPVGKVVSSLPAGAPKHGFGGPSAVGFDEASIKALEVYGAFWVDVARTAPQCASVKDFRDVVMDAVTDHVFVVDKVGGRTVGLGGKKKSKRTKKKLAVHAIGESVEMLDATSGGGGEVPAMVDDPLTSIGNVIGEANVDKLFYL